MGQAGITTDLRPRWRALTSGWGASPDAVDAAYDDLVSRYAEPHRRYHTLEHIAETLAFVDGGAVELAAWFHDVIYDATTTDSEPRSARHAAEVLGLLGAPADLIAEVHRLILLTAGHTVDDHDANGSRLVAADLAILSADADRYNRYVTDVRAEYAHVDDESWRVGRANVLRSLLDVVDDDRARVNITGELARLAPPQT